MIRIERLTKKFGEKETVKEIDLEIHKGEIFTFIGPSGSGKTTLIRLIDLLDWPTSGTIFFDGIDTSGTEQVRLAVRRRMGMVFQKPAHALIRVKDICFEALTDLQAGQRAALYIRPEEVTLTPAEVSPAKSSMRNQLFGRIKKIQPSGPFVRITVDCGFPLTALITRRSCTELGFALGSAVLGGVKATAIHVLPEDEETIHG